MLRVNLLNDEAFRNDILDMVRSGLRDAVPKAIAEKFGDNGWLEKRFDQALERLRLPDMISNHLKSRSLWESETVREALQRYIRIHFGDAAQNEMRELRTSFEQLHIGSVSALQQSLNTKAQKIIGDFAAKMRGEIRQIVAEELRKRLTA
jgi:hypothetical protein